jgi:hypothetical protein
VGYNVCRLATPARHAVLQPFGPDDIQRFVRQWHNAYEKTAHSQSPDHRRAAQDAQALLDEIRANPHVASLASNPLMLTIIALIKQRDVTLPERRVELYEAAIRTLLQSWNKARSLSRLPLGTEPRLEQTKRVWAAVAHWMHKETNRGTLPRSRLHQKLVEVLVGRDLTEHQAEAEAESYLQTATESTGLLEARGPNTFAFVHQTFQEYLAANQLAIPTRRAVEQILRVVGDPRWHEVIRLAVGIIGVYQVDEEVLTQLVDELIADDQDPLEPFLCTRLRLVAACMADDVGFRQRDINRVIERLAERLMSLPAQWPVRSPLIQALESLPTVQPERLADTTVMALRRLAEHHDEEIRKAGALKLSEIANRNDTAQQI